MNRQVLADVAAEGVLTEEVWGEQHHPNGTGPDVRPLAVLGYYGSNTTARRLAAAAKRAVDAAAADGTTTWLPILLEEVFEAAEEDNPARLRGELVQIANVAVQWVKDLDRQAAADRRQQIAAGA